MNNEINVTPVNIEEEQTNDIQNFINFLNEVFDNDENFELNNDKNIMLSKESVKELVEDKLKELAINFNGELPSKFYSALRKAEFYFTLCSESYGLYEGDGTDWFVISKGNKKILIDLSVIDNIATEQMNEIQNFINFLNEVFNNDENFTRSPFIKLPYVGKYETCRLAGNKLKKVKGNFAGKKLPAEFYSALESAGYDFSDGTKFGSNYFMIKKNDKALWSINLLYY